MIGLTHPHISTETCWTSSPGILRGEKIYLHCWGGRGRSGDVARDVRRDGCWKESSGHTIYAMYRMYGLLWICFLVRGDWNHGILWLSISWECHIPNWRTHSIIFQRGGEKTPTSFWFLWWTWGSSTSLDFTGACGWTKPHPVILLCRYGFETKDRLIVPFNRGRDKVYRLYSACE